MALKTLNTLIKLHKRRLDVLQRELRAMEDERRQLLELAAKLTREHQEESRLSAAEPKIGSFFGAYSAQVKARQAGIREEVVRLDRAIAEKAEIIRGEFSEQKKFEIARESAQKRLAEETRHRLQQRFDEIGVQQYLRQTPENG